MSKYFIALFFAVILAGGLSLVFPRSAQNFWVASVSLIRDSFGGGEVIDEIPLGESGGYFSSEVSEKSAEKTETSLMAAPICSFIPGSAATQKLILNEIAWMGTETDSKNEWIELKNVSGEVLDISGWAIKDKDEQINFRFPKNSSVPAGGFYLLERYEEATAEKADSLYSGNLKNSAESLYVFDKECGLVDYAEASPIWPAGDNISKNTMERAGNLSWHDSELKNGTPKKENSTSQKSIKLEVQSIESTKTTSTVQAEVAVSAGVLINEIFYDAEGGDTGKEFIELYNPTGKDISLEGWSLSNKSTSLIKISSKPEDTLTIKKGGFYLVGFNNYNGPPVADAKRSASLPNSAASIILSDAMGAVIDSVSYNNSVSAGQSYERASFGDNRFSAQPNPNPKNSNML